MTTATRRKSSLIRKQLREAVSSNKSIRVDRAAGIIYGVKICGRISPNTHGVRGVEGTVYTENFLQEALELYEGINVNVDHPPRSTPGADRSARDRFAWLENVELQEGGDFGDLHFLNPKDPLAINIMNAAEKKPDAFALSHNAYGSGEVKNGFYVVDKPEKIHSVDIVANGGSNRSLFESREKPMKKYTARTIRKAFARLLEMDEPGGEMPKKKGAICEDDDAAADAGNGLAAILADHTLSKAQKRAKVLAALKLGDDDPDSEELEEDDEEEEETSKPGEEVEKPVKEKYEEGESISGKNADGQRAAVMIGLEGKSKYARANESLRFVPSKNPAVRSLQEALRTEVAERRALQTKLELRELCEAEQFSPTKLQLEILESLDAKKRKAFIQESKVGKPKAKAPRTGSYITTGLQESALPKTAAEQAKFLLRA